MKAIDILSGKKQLNEFYFPEDDEGNKADYTDTRRPRLTLRHLHKLRKIRDLKHLEASQHKIFVATMYGPSTDDESGF